MGEKFPFGSIRVCGDELPLTLLGWFVVNVVVSLIIVGCVWLGIVLTCFAFS